jgi:hypothetical protein
VRVAQIMDPHMDSQVRGFKSWHPDVLAKPPAGDVAIGVDDSGLPGLVLASCPALGPVRGKRSFPVGAPAVAGVVSTERACKYRRPVLFGSVSPSCSGFGMTLRRGVAWASGTIMKNKSSEPRSL